LRGLCGLKDFYRIVEDHDGDTVPFSEICLPDDESYRRAAQHFADHHEDH
jgi:hypothetical protein